MTGAMRSHYVYMPTKLAIKMHRFYIHKYTISANIRNYGITPQYLRKWFYSFLIMNNVPDSLADFIEDKAPESVWIHALPF